MNHFSTNSGGILKTFERLAGLLLILFVIAACGQQAQEAAMEEEEPVVTEETTSAVRQAYPNLPSDVVFENDQIVAQRVTAEPGTWAGEHSHPAGQVAVVLKGGTQTYREGGEESERVFEAGEVIAVEPTDAHDHMLSGDGADFVLITLAPGEPGTATSQDYPNRPAEVVLETDRVIGQRLIGEPGGWVGEHAHTEGQLAVVIKGGTMTYREGGEETERTFTEGEVFMVEATAAHDHAVTSDSGVESILFTLK
jgi:quercetin dioxygenase-like cupin family protein